MSRLHLYFSVTIPLALVVFIGGVMVYAAVWEDPITPTLNPGRLEPPRRLPSITEASSAAEEANTAEKPTMAAQEPAPKEEEKNAGPVLPQLAPPQNSPPEDGGAGSGEKEKKPEKPVRAGEDSPSPNPPEKSGEMPSVEGAVEKHHPAEAKKSAKTAVGEEEKNAASGAKTPPPAENPPPPPKPKRTLTPELAALRDQVRQILAVHHKQPFNTRQNTACEIMDFCLAFGCDTEIILVDRTGEHRINGITCLCWNHPSAGFEPLMLSEGRIAARLGFGTQWRPSQMLAMLAFARVQSNYPLRVGGAVRTVADLIESEKQDCRSGGDLSLKLIALSYYVDEPTWKNALGEEWSVERIVREELAAPMPTDHSSGLDRLLGLGYAVVLREKRNQPLEGDFARAKKYVADFQQYAFGVQNPDGSWGYFLAGRGANRDADAALRSTAYVLEWLAATYSEEKLDDPRIVAAVKYLLQALSSRQYRYNASVLSTQDINSYAHALHALSEYDDHYFRPADEEKPAAEAQPEKPAAEPAPAARSVRNAK